MVATIFPSGAKTSQTPMVCIRRADGTRETAFVAFDPDDKAQSVVYLDATEGVLTLGAGDTVTAGECPLHQVDCVESLEYTYGLDNTGTRYNDTATYEIEFSDGQILTFEQTPTGGWSDQLTQWAAAVQVAMDGVGIVGFAEPRFVDNPNPSNIDGTINGPGGTPSGLPGAPSSRIAELLIAGGMSWRYVNFQMCAGQPVPVAARRVASALYGDDEYILNTAGPIKGTINKFYVCRECGQEPVWYLADNTTLATAGQIPDCFSPCGLLELQAPPPGSDCQFQFDTACDNNNSTDPLLFTNLITRRVTYCEGEQVAVEYYREDPLDPAALEPYTLVGEYVDCASGEPVEVPPPDCQNVTYVGQLYRFPTTAVAGSNVEWWAPASFPAGSNAAPHGNVSDIFTNDGTNLNHVNGAPDVAFQSPVFSVEGTNTASFISAVGATGSSQTTGTDQLKLSGYIVVNSPARLRDGGTRTGERGGLWINKCCAGELELLEERTVDTAGSETGVFNGTVIPVGIHYIEAVTSDLSSWQNLTLEVSYDDGDTYEPFTSYLRKPSYECVPVLRCNDTGVLIRGDNPVVEVITVGEFDLWCEPPACIADAPASGGAAFDGNVTDVTPNPDQTHTIVHGTGSVPAGLKSVTINNISGITTIDGAFEIGNGRRVDAITYSATEIDRARGLLPAIALSGGTWQWTGIQPVAEV